MSNANKWLGFGRVKFEKEINGELVTADFPDGKGSILYQEIYAYNRQNIDYNERYKIVGYRVFIAVERLANVRSTDPEQFQNLARILTSQIGTNETFTCYPRFSENEAPLIASNLSYDVRNDGGISPEDKHLVETWQEASMQLVAPTKTTEVPDMLRWRKQANFTFKTSASTTRNATFETSAGVDENAIVEVPDEE
jgi:hypothetical protein